MVYIVGIAGGSGSGKTTFTKNVIADLKNQANVLHLDSYYCHQLPAKIENNFDHPDAFDWELLESHLKDLKQGKGIEAPTYDFKTNSRSPQSSFFFPKKIIFLEGIYSLYSQSIRNLLDLKCYLQVDADIRLIRRMNRDVKERARSLESVIEQYLLTVRPMHRKFIESQKEHADFIVGEENDRSVALLQNHLLHLLEESSPNTSELYGLLELSELHERQEEQSIESLH